jgi:16S rRNA (guanine966-N2)-methyltransferase
MTGERLRNRVRIIGGQWRSRLIRFPDVRGLRPTPDRVRETVFNWLGQDLTGKRVLDLFAGSGALGLEAASRGAREVVMVERDAQAFRALAESVRQLGDGPVRLAHADALEFLASDVGLYEVVFLDPPYARGDRDVMLARVRPRLAPGALVYVEAAQAMQPPAGWAAFRSARAGAVHFQLLRAGE